MFQRIKLFYFSFHFFRFQINFFFTFFAYTLRVKNSCQIFFFLWISILIFHFFFKILKLNLIQHLFILNSLTRILHSLIYYLLPQISGIIKLFKFFHIYLMLFKRIHEHLLKLIYLMRSILRNLLNQILNLKIFIL